MEGIEASDQSATRLMPAALVFAISFSVILILHFPLLRLPYFWDEAGYYIPAARDLFLSGTLIPHSTPSNAHPPVIMAYLSACWKIAGYSLVTTRVAMLVIAAFSLTGLVRLAEVVANRQVAIATAVCTAIYPIFFVQSSLAQVDLAAAGFTFWGLHAYIQNRRWAIGFWMSLAALTKETAILAPVALVAWELLSAYLRNARWPHMGSGSKNRGQRLLALILPFIILAAWYVYHYRMTGYLLGNPEYFRYNVQSTLNPLRAVVALGLRLWQTFGYLHLWILSAAMALAMYRPALKNAHEQRKRIAIPTQLIFLAVTLVYVVFMSIVGGAALARYMLPVVPLVILTAVSTLWRRVQRWVAILAIVIASFAASLFGLRPTDSPSKTISRTAITSSCTSVPLNSSKSDSLPLAC